MGKYRIADFTIEMEVRGERLLRQGAAYRVADDAPVDFVLDASARIESGIPQVQAQAELVARNDFEALLKANNGREFDMNDVATTYDELEYIATGAVFLLRALEYDGIGLHASAVVYQDRAYLFSASSGVGKSTHTRQWLRLFGSDKAYILNDDKPMLRRIDGRWFAYGTPWSGKSDLNAPARVPLGGIAFLERAPENWIRPVAANEALFPFLNQTLRPCGRRAMEIALNRAVELLSEAPIYRLGCLPNLEAARVAYAGMSSGRSFGSGS